MSTVTEASTSDL